MNNLNRIKSLQETLPYLHDTSSKIIVIKYGGSAMTDPDLTLSVIQDIATLSLLGFKIILVHGGGPAINEWLEKLQMKPKFKNGIRITDSRTMELVQMVLSGKINKDLVGILGSLNVRAVGLSGKDGQLILADSIELYAENKVGKIRVIDTHILEILLENQYMPVVAPIGTNESGLSFNINADTVASEIASAIKASSLIMLTDTPGILKDFSAPDTLYPNLDLKNLEELINNGTIVGGMLPKVHGCIKALKDGVQSIRIIDGRLPHSLLLTLLSEAHVGSVLTL
jgi:acetylglutamate kinase|uniref:Acetylglutamate kinase n=1 Tax=Palmaria decipiens TaxID=187399 RepID=A0A6C0W1J2_PALDE|nr:acetylglutamate kinase [Palmaria decipiens]QIC19501.1 acetylglutamate kinase [Palmaria decipiens]